LVTILLSSGCIQKFADIADVATGGDCGEVEKELQQKGRDCKCYPTDFVPDKFKNKTGIEGKCYCVCEVGEGANKTTKEVSIAQTRDGGYIISNMGS
jgi:hypothetical protein